MSRAFILGVSGGSCSGKTTLARALTELLGAERCALIYQDSYYIDQSHRFREDGGEVNFDHPDSLEFSLLAKHLDELRGGRSVEVPIYDFVTHTRSGRTQTLASRPVVIVDGTLILSQPAVRERLDASVFVEADEELRFSRRKERDTRERGRALEGVVKQFRNHVKPMHDLFVEPSKGFASERLPGQGSSEDAARRLIEKLGLAK